MSRNRSLFVIFLLAVGADQVDATPITFEFVAEVTGISDSSFFLCPAQPLSPCRVGSAGMIVGDRFSGSYTFDSSATGIRLTDGTVVYGF